jgi:hypothetical protein
MSFASGVPLKLTRRLHCWFWPAAGRFSGWLRYWRSRSVADFAAHGCGHGPCAPESECRLSPNLCCVGSISPTSAVQTVLASKVAPARGFSALPPIAVVSLCARNSPSAIAYSRTPCVAGDAGRSVATLDSQRSVRQGRLINQPRRPAPRRTVWHQVEPRRPVIPFWSRYVPPRANRANGPATRPSR